MHRKFGNRPLAQAKILLSLSQSVGQNSNCRKNRKDSNIRAVGKDYFVDPAFLCGQVFGNKHEKSLRGVIWLFDGAKWLMDRRGKIDTFVLATVIIFITLSSSLCKNRLSIFQLRRVCILEYEKREEGKEREEGRREWNQVQARYWLAVNKMAILNYRESTILPRYRINV